MKIFYKITTVLLFLISVLFLLQNPVLAEDNDSSGLTISPAVFNFDVVGGEEFEREVTIANNYDFALPILVTYNNFTAADEYGGISFSEQTGEFSPSSWLKVQPENFIIKPNSVQKISLKIAVPYDVPAGGYYAAILFEPKMPSFYYQDNATRILPVIGELILFNVQKVNIEPLITADYFEVNYFGFGNEIDRVTWLEMLYNFVRNNLSLAEAQATDDIYIIKSKPDKLLLSLKNNNIFHVRPQGNISLLNMFGHEVYQQSLPQTTILPSRQRIIGLDFNWYDQNASALPLGVMLGRYKVVMNIDYNDQNYTEYLYFWVFPWPIILSTVLIFCLIVHFMVQYKQRFMKFFSVLITGKK